ncbi:uncharacterized protein [Rutidosis leptorrhynchoides]|uniref:uncharacterized protein n=1 Tax=Rutidosis leptorrhynchoides TaxID=125765 RepID=UPI003A997651
MVFFNDQGNMEWDFGLSSSLDEYDERQVVTLKHLIRHVSLDLDKEDTILWVHSVDKVYSVAEGVRVMLESNLDKEFDWVKIVWNKLVPSKIAIFHWLAIQGGVPVKEVLSFLHFLRDGSNDKCGWCTSEVESIDHLLLHCPWSHNVWSALFAWWNVVWVMPSSIIDFFIECFHGLGVNAKKTWRLIGPVSFWLIWLARNDFLFNGSYQSWRCVVEHVKIKVFQWLVNAGKVESHQMYV